MEALINVLQVVAPPSSGTEAQILYRLVKAPVPFQFVVHGFTKAGPTVNLYARNRDFGEKVEQRMRATKLGCAFEMALFEVYRLVDECIYWIGSRLCPESKLQLWEWYDFLTMVDLPGICLEEGFKLFI